LQVEAAESTAPVGGWRDSLRTGLTCFAIYRTVTLVVIVVGGLGSQFIHLLRHDPGVLYGLFHQYDAMWFTEIAEKGYGREGLAAFPPAYPLAVRAVSTVLHIPTMAAAVLLSSLCLAAALVLLHRLVAAQFGSVVASTTLFLLLVWPSSVFLGLAFADAMFLLVLLGSFMAAQRQRWLLAGLLMAVASMAKIYGGLLTFAIAVEYMESRGWDWRRVRADLLLIFLPTALAFAGLMLYMSHRFGQPLLFLTAQAQWGKRPSFPWGGIQQGIHNVLNSPERIVMSLDLLAVLLVLVATPVVYRRIRRSYGVMLGLSFLAFTTTHDILAASRHLTACFPLFILAALCAQRRPKLAERVIAPLSALAAGTLLVAFTQGHWAG
jgi:hypothetical protein